MYMWHADTDGPTDTHGVAFVLSALMVNLSPRTKHLMKEVNTSFPFLIIPHISIKHTTPYLICFRKCWLLCHRKLLPTHKASTTTPEAAKSLTQSVPMLPGLPAVAAEPTVRRGRSHPHGVSGCETQGESQALSSLASSLLQRKWKPKDGEFGQKAYRIHWLVSQQLNNREWSLIAYTAIQPMSVGINTPQYRGGTEASQTYSTHE